MSAQSQDACLSWVGTLVTGMLNLTDDLAAAVTDAREAGATWTAIAAELGVSRQAAQQRYGR